MKKLILFSVLSFAIWSNAFGQGCSDAGFCTMGAMKPDQHFNKKIKLKLNSMEVGYYKGTTTLSPIIQSITADLNFTLNNKNTFQVKAPFQWVHGSKGETSGLGDISLCYTRNLIAKEKIHLNVSLGSKIPSNKADKRGEYKGLDRPLPMYYQTSLGTYDAIAGVSAITRKWLFATGIQIPFNKNGNQFLWADWVQGLTQKEIDYVRKYAKAKELKRGIDVMFRVERNFRFSRLNFSVGLLPIYRITNDEITNPAGEREKPVGAKGLALSGIATAGYSFNVKHGIKFLFGRKIINRDVNPDGLSRVVVNTVTYYYRF